VPVATCPENGTYFVICSFGASNTESYAVITASLYKKDLGTGSPNVINYTYKTFGGNSGTSCAIHTVIQLNATDTVGLQYNMANSGVSGSIYNVLITLIKISA